MEKTKTYAQALAEAVDWLQRNKATPRYAKYVPQWQQRVDGLVRALPSGSGWDCGTDIDLDRSTKTCIVLTGSFHHMDEHGGYAGWTEHTIVVTPEFGGIAIRITGRNRNDIKGYLSDTFRIRGDLTMDKHIIGTWCTDIDTSGAVVVTSDIYGVVAIPQGESSLANAYLIAEAPDLLDALRIAAAGFATIANNLPASGEAARLVALDNFDACKLAIARVEGKC